MALNKKEKALVSYLIGQTYGNVATNVGKHFIPFSIEEKEILEDLKANLQELRNLLEIS
jgi:hypothetical protein